MDNIKLLVCDDDNNICELLRLYLVKEGYSVVLAQSGTEALSLFHKERPDMVLLDIMMPGMDGWQVCREIRKTSDCPIIMITAKGETFDKVLGLELGADDYMIKPFDSKELVARVKAVLRRLGKQQETGVIEYQNIRMVPSSHQVHVGEREVSLTLKEYELLKYLLENLGTVLTRDQLLNYVWGYDFDGETRTVDVHIRTLRQKLGEAGEMIKTIRGVGYRIGE